MYGIDLFVQFENIMPAVGLGFILGFVYDLFRFIRQIFSDEKTVVFITDMIFVLVCTLSSFLLFLAVNSGRIRGYLIIFEVLAATVYRFTAGKLISFVLSKSAELINRLFSEIFSLIKVPLKGIYTFILKMSVLIKKILKKSKINSENPLKDTTEM